MDLISVVLVDNHSFYREGMKYVLESEMNFNVIIDGDSDMSVIDIVKKETPTLLLIDVNVLNEQSIHINKDIVAHSPHTKVIVIAFEYEGSYVTDALKKGAYGFLLKNMNITQFIEAVEAVLDNMYQVDQRMSHYVVQDYVNMVSKMDQATSNQKGKQPLHIYTKRECEVLQLLAEGMSNRMIAQTLDISEKTVKNHISNIFKKMNVNDRTQAVITAIRNDWVTIN